jgi:outer membrane lipoprotein carrier protein
MACLSLPGAEPVALLRGFESRYNSARTLTVLFQENYTVAGRARRTESGTLTLEKPGRMRWEYGGGKLFLSDGKNVWFYTPASRRCERSRLKDAEDFRAPMAFLLGKLDFKKQFQGVTIDGRRIRARARSEAMPYEQVDFDVRPDGSIERLGIVQRDGATLEFTFQGERLNVPVRGEQFRFTPPPDVEVVAVKGN